MARCAQSILSLLRARCLCATTGSTISAGWRCLRAFGLLDSTVWRLVSEDSLSRDGNVKLFPQWAVDKLLEGECMRANAMVGKGPTNLSGRAAPSPVLRVRMPDEELAAAKAKANGGIQDICRTWCAICWREGSAEVKHND